MIPKIFIQKPPSIEIIEFIETVKSDCDGIQLYISKTAGGIGAFKVVKETLKQNELRVIIHLSDDFSSNDLLVANYLAGTLGIFITHYHPEKRNSPLSIGVHGMENAIFGIDKSYYDSWLREAKKLGRLPIFDIPRLFKNEAIQDASLETNRILSLLNHYVLHLIDFSDNQIKRRDFTPLGKGLLSPFLEKIRWKVFPTAIVLEFENLQQSLESISFVKKLFTT